MSIQLPMVLSNIITKLGMRGTIINLPVNLNKCLDLVRISCSFDI
jgi:hypothetical protein